MHDSEFKVLKINPRLKRIVTAWRHGSKKKKKAHVYSYFNLINAHLFRYDTFKYQDNQMINNSLEIKWNKNLFVWYKYFLHQWWMKHVHNLYV